VILVSFVFTDETGVRQRPAVIVSSNAYHSGRKRTIYKLTQESRLPAFHIGHERHRRFQKEDLDKALRPGVDTKSPGGLPTLTARADPVLAELWDNDRDAVYDRI